MHLDPWEASALDRALGERSDGKWSAFSVGIIVPRQNGKGAILEARELAGLFLFDERLIMHSAHEFKTAAEAFLRVLMLVESTPDLDRRVQRVRKAHGEEAIELRSGQRLRFVARSTGSGRGFTGDTVILDEAYNLNSKAISALVPTMATRPNPQLWYTSSAPLDGPESEVLRKLCVRGRSGTSESLAYMEFCANADDPYDAPETWAKANPGFGVRIHEEFIRHEREEFATDEDFARERLGIWNATDDGSDWVIPKEDWYRCQTANGMLGEPTGIAFDMAPDRRSAWFAVAGPSAAGGTHLEVVEPDSRKTYAARAAELHESYGVPISIAQNSPAWALKDDFEAAGAEVLPVSTAEHAQACGQIYDAALATQIHHPGQPVVATALGGASQNYTQGDAWLWSRRKSTVDISPLVACTLALWASSQAADPEPGYRSMEELLA